MTEIARLEAIVTADTTAAERSMGAFNGSFAKTAGAVAVGTAALNAFESAAEGIADGISTTIKSAAGFEHQMSAIKAVSGATGDEMQTLSKLALQLGADTSFSASEAGQGIEELIKAGVGLGDVMGGGAKASLDLAAAGAVSVSEAATIASNALNSFGLTGADMAHAADEIAGAANASAIDVHQFGFSLSAVGAVAHAVGMSFDDTTTAIAVLGQAGLKGSDAGTSLKTALLNLHPVTNKQIELFDELGITTNGMGNKFYDAEGNFAGLRNMADVLKTALSGMTREQQLATLEMIGGSDAVRAFAIFMDGGSEAIDKMDASIKKISASDVANTRLDNLSGSIEKLSGSAETAQIAFGTGLLPTIRRLADASTQFVNDHIGDFEAWGASVGRAGTLAIGGISEFASQVGPKLAPASEALTTFKQAAEGDWAPDPASIAPFTEAAGEAGVNVRALTLAILDFKGQVATPGTALSDLKIGIDNVGVAAKITEDALNLMLAKSDASKSSLSGFNDLSITAGLKDLSGGLVGVATSFQIFAEVARAAGSGVINTLNSVGLAEQGAFQEMQSFLAGISGDWARAAEMQAQSDASFQRSRQSFIQGQKDIASIGPIMEGAAARVQAAVQENLLPHLQSVPISSAQMAAAIDQDAAEMSAGFAQHLGQEIPQTVEQMAAAVDADMVSVSDSMATNWNSATNQATAAAAGLVTGVHAELTTLPSSIQPDLDSYYGVVTTGFANGTMAATTEATATVDGVNTQLATLPTVVEPSLAAYTGVVTTESTNATTAATTGATALVTESSAIIATLPAEAETGLAGLTETVTTQGDAATTGLQSALTPMADNTRSQMTDVAAAADAPLAGLETTASSRGSGMVTAFGSGIRSKLDVVKAGVMLMVSEIDKLLPHSDAETGPLSTLTQSGAAIPTTMAAGVNASAGVLGDAVTRLAVTASLPISPAAAAVTGQSYAEALIKGLVDHFSGGSEAVGDAIRAVVESAIANNVDPIIAAALAKAESSFNPFASGDSGTSTGLFQLRRPGQGTGFSTEQLQNPRFNAGQFLSSHKDLFAQLSQQFSGAELARQFGGQAEVSDPQFWGRYAEAFNEISAALGPMSQGLDSAAGSSDALTAASTETAGAEAALKVAGDAKTLMATKQGGVLTTTAGAADTLASANEAATSAESAHADIAATLTQGITDSASAVGLAATGAIDLAAAHEGVASTLDGSTTPAVGAATQAALDAVNADVLWNEQLRASEAQLQAGSTPALIAQSTAFSDGTNAALAAVSADQLWNQQLAATEDQLINGSTPALVDQNLKTQDLTTLTDTALASVNLFGGASTTLGTQLATITTPATVAQNDAAAIAATNSDAAALAMQNFWGQSSTVATTLSTATTPATIAQNDAFSDGTNKALAAVSADVQWNQQLREAEANLGKTTPATTGLNTKISDQTKAALEAVQADVAWNKSLRDAEKQAGDTADAVDDLAKAIKEASKAVGSAAGTALENAFKIAGKAGGGSVYADTPYLVGEEGPELFVPGRSGSIVPNNRLAVGGGDYYAGDVHITIQGSVDSADRVREIEEAVRNAMAFGDGRRLGF